MEPVYLKVKTITTLAYKSQELIDDAEAAERAILQCMALFQVMPKEKYEPLNRHPYLWSGWQC